jgi:hypothetical protein
MTVIIQFVNDIIEVECEDYAVNSDGRLILRDSSEETLFVVNVDRWIWFKIKRNKNLLADDKPGY